MLKHAWFQQPGKHIDPIHLHLAKKIHRQNIWQISTLAAQCQKQTKIFAKNNPDMYDKCFGISEITYPAALNDFIHLADQIQGNHKLDKMVWPALMSILPDDFRPLGRSAHIFIPKYMYVLKEVFMYLNIQLPKGTLAYHLTRQFCCTGRQEANKWTDRKDVTQSVTHWTDILLDTKATKTMQFNLIDIIQAKAAQK
jgi:hypothetical protein